MGVGTPADLVRSVARGIDMFDCVMPTRNARNGHLFTSAGVVRIRNAAHQDDRAERCGDSASVPPATTPPPRVPSAHPHLPHASILTRRAGADMTKAADRSPPPSPVTQLRIATESNWLIADCVTSCEVEMIPASCVAAAVERVTGAPIGT